MPAAADFMQRWVGLIGLAVAVGIAYFLAARLSLALLTGPGGVAVFWPAAGVAAGILIVFGPGARLPVAAGAICATIAANLLGDRTPASAILFALCNAGEALLTAHLVERYFGPGFGLDRLRHVLGLLAAAIFAAAVSGIGGTLGFKWLHSSTDPILTIWWHWVASDGLGILTVVPLLIGIASVARDPPPRRQSVEAFVALLALTAMSGLVIFLPREPWAIVVPIAFLFPLLLWLTARCRPAFAAAAAFIVALTIVGTTTFGIGHFGDASLPVAERIIGAQSGILTVSLCALVLAALFAERRQLEAVLMESEARLQEALTAGAVMAFEWDVRSGLSRRSANAGQMLGLDAKEMLAATQFHAWVHPDDRAHYTAFVRGVRPDHPSYAVTFRIVRPDGREMWLEEVAKAEFDAAGRCVRIKGLTFDISERKRAETHQSRLIAELDHRVKNVLARVSVVAMYTRQGSSSMDDFVQALDRRIQSMADAHALLSQSRWQGVSLTDLVRRQLAPYATDANSMIEGPDVELTSVAAEAMAMVLQELVTNAAKYGSLSIPDGRVSVSWGSRPSGDEASLMIVWRELGGPTTAAPAQFGYGTSLIRDLIPHELGGSVDLVFASSGVRCTIEIPFGRVDNPKKDPSGSALP
jgi:PAS domain S-box-containing protein